MILERFSTVIKLVIIALSIWFITDIVMTVLSARLDVSPQAKIVHTLKKKTETQKRPLEYYSIIASKNIFNPLSKATDNTVKKDEPSILETLSPTELNLRLKGTTTGDVESSFAIIEDMDKRKQDLYRLDDTIKDARITKILNDSIVLIRNGREEVLTMTPDEAKRNRPTPSKRNPAKDVERISSNKYILHRENINDTIDNLNQFMTQFKVQPYYKEGKPSGFEMSQIKPGSLISKIGLINGDIIKSINDVSLESPDQAIEVYQQIQTRSSMTLKLERNGRNRIYNYELR